MDRVANGSALSEIFRTLGGAMFRSCGIPGCEHRSLGLVCKCCKRFMCQRHAYARPTVPPVLICASCIITEHEELLEDDGQGPAPPPRARSSTRQRNDDDVIDAEVVE